MVEGAGFAIFLTGTLLLNITPGPDMAFTLASTARGGAKSGIAAALGVGAGSLVWALATALGLAAMLSASQHALTVIRIVGGLYLLYLAAKTLMKPAAADLPQGARGLFSSFQSGVTTNLFNPKVGLFFLAFLPGFASTDRHDLALQIFLLGAVFSVTGALVLMLVAVAAGAVRERLFGSTRFQRTLKWMSASMFGGLGVFLIASGDR